MRTSFSGFYGVSEDTIGTVLRSDDTIFIFDTNILLTLYRCEEETRNHFFDIWRKVKDKSWFPHHVCLEYQRNRLNVVKGSRDSLSAISKKVINYISELKKEIDGDAFSQTISRYSNLRGEIENLFEEIDSCVQSFTEQSISIRNGKIDFFRSHDVIRDVIDELTHGHIGPAPENQAIVNELNKVGRERYKYKTGPGYEDSANKKNEFFSFNGINYDAEYSDYYVWSQILDHVQFNPNKNIVYVTNDAKSDFFYKIDGKVRGPNESLISEIKKKGASEFLLQNIDTFLHHANNHLNAEMDESTISELANASYMIELSKEQLRKAFVNNVKLLSAVTHSLIGGEKNNSPYESYTEARENLKNLINELKVLEDAPTDTFNNVQLAEHAEMKRILKMKINSLGRAVDIIGKNAID